MDILIGKKYIYTSEVPKSLQILIMREDWYIRSRWLWNKSSAMSRFPLAINRTAWVKIKGPDEVTRAFSRYSSSDGVYPKLNHFASTSNDLQKSAHCDNLTKQLCFGR